jgi:hypothetical protein
VASWQLLTSRCSVKLSPEEVDSFGDALRIYPTKAQVVKYNHDHMLGLASPAVQVEAIHEGVGAEKVERLEYVRRVRRHAERNDVVLLAVELEVGRVVAVVAVEDEEAINPSCSSFSMLVEVLNVF